MVIQRINLGEGLPDKSINLQECSDLDYSEGTIEFLTGRLSLPRQEQTRETFAVSSATILDR